MGQTHLGHLVGLGCKNYINVNFSTILLNVFIVLENFFKSILLATEPPGEIKAQIETATLGEILNLFETQLTETANN